jgi:hypothetical protein
MCQSCEIRNLPQPIQDLVRQEAPGWQILTRDMLGQDDGPEWDADHHGCPGMLKGNFIPGIDTYAISLVRQESGGKFQQFIVVALGSSGTHKYVLTSPTKVPVWSVVLKESPGKYRDIRNGRHITSSTELVALVRLDVGEALYHWTGSRFERMITSD